MHKIPNPDPANKNAAQRTSSFWYPQIKSNAKIKRRTTLEEAEEVLWPPMTGFSYRCLTSTSRSEVYIIKLSMEGHNQS